ncbi:MAG: MFS transporter [Thermoplasmata archaeon]|nr:MFS transporter [Thermoplasmata archaeon]
MVQAETGVTPTELQSGRRLARDPNFLKLLGATLASYTGGAVAQVCLLWLIFSATGSALDVGYFGAAALGAGILFSLVGGTLVDRYDRRRLMSGANLAAAGTVGLLVVVLWTRGFSLLAVLAATFVVSALRTIFAPAEQAIVPAVVGPGSIASANGVLHSVQSTMSLLGSSVGGVMILTVGPIVGIGVNAATFLVAGLLIASLVVPTARASERGSSGRRGAFVADLREGFAWLRRARGLLELTISAGFFNFFESLFFAFLVVYDALALHGSALVFGGLLVALTAGQGLGALTVGRTRAVRYAGRLWVLGAGCAGGAGLLTLAVFPVIPVAVPVVFLMGYAAGVAGTVWLTAAQLVVPTEMQGRYFGIDSLGSWAIIPLAQIGGGLLVVRYGILPTYLVGGILWTVAGAGFLLPRALARFGHPPREEVATEKAELVVP